LYNIFVDINECLNKTLHNCHPDAKCKDTIGSYTCECNDGYTGDGVTCTGN